ncbi:recombinase family protein [bacterium]|nr:recombinase family protein [bacterium]
MNNLNHQTKKLFLYARKSTDEPERQVLSIEAQLFELQEYAKKEGLNIVHEFIESKTQHGLSIFGMNVIEKQAVYQNQLNRNFLPANHAKVILTTEM